MTAPADLFLTELAAVLGSGSVLRGDDATGYAVDGRGYSVGDDPVVVRPRDVAGVAETVRRCREAGVAIVAQGGNTGMSHGTMLPVDRPSILLSLARLDQILSVDPDRWTMTVQAGVTIQAVQEAAAAAGRRFAPDWGARGTATVGGAIATDAGGNNVVRYGNMRDNVLGVEAVLADGAVWDGRRALRKDSTGYDLKQLLIGSEGTLGVVTSAVLKLVPATAHQQSALLAIPGLAVLSELFELAQTSAAGSLSAFELLPDVAIDRVVEVFGHAKPLDSGTDYFVLLTLASSETVEPRLAALLEAAAKRDLLVDAVVAGTPEQEANLWGIRDHASPTACFVGFQHHGLKLDTAIPLDRVAEFVTGVQSRAAAIAPMALCYGFGHVGDGNIHMMVLPTDDDSVEPWLAVRDELTASIDELVFSMAGTLSAEHGIGLLLRDRIGPQKSDLEWELMHRIKAVFDPDGILNPGKMLPPRAPNA
jgi:FAD/FMN-containing dehydrogenase